jgi:adenine-specific DNA-methyltransferase
MSPWTLHQADALEAVAEMPDGSVNAIITDPPYFRVKDEEWDRAWADRGAFLAWLGRAADDWRRVLVQNGSVVVFASPQMAAHVEVMLAERFNVLNHIVWAKPSGWWKKQHRPGLRAFAPQTERIIFAEHHGADRTALGLSGYAAKCDEARAFVFEPLRRYLADECAAAGLTVGSIDAAWRAERGTKGGMARHWLMASQWLLPTEENYLWLRRLANGEHLRREYEHLRREYEELRREYEELRREYEELRRPFDATEGPHTDVWAFPPVENSQGKHPCEKPAALVEHLVRCITRPGDLVLDPFAGSGATGLAALALGRRFVGVELDPRWAAAARSSLGAPRQVGLGL